MNVLTSILNRIVANLIVASFVPSEDKEQLILQASPEKKEKILSEIFNHPQFPEYYAGINFAYEFMNEYDSTLKVEEKLGLEKLTSTKDLISLFLSLMKKSKTDDKVSQLWYAAAAQKLLLSSHLEKEIMNDRKNHSKPVSKITVSDVQNLKWNINKESAKIQESFWLINEKGEFTAFPEIFSQQDSEKLLSLEKAKDLSEEESLELEDLRERSDIQNYAVNFENRMIELIIGIGLSANRTFFPKKKKYEGKVSDYLKKCFQKQKKDVEKYNDYRKNLMFLDTIFIKKDITGFFKESKKEKLETDFLDTYWEVVRDKFFWNKINITPSVNAMANFSNFKLEKTLGKYNPDNIMNNFIRSFFLFVLKQIRRRVDNSFFNLAGQIAKFYKPKGFFMKFDDEVEKGRIFFENPESIAKNYFEKPQEILKKDLVSQYKNKALTFKAMYNKMDMRSSIIGQQLKTDFNHCFKNKNIVGLLNQRRKESLKLKKDKEIVKILPKKYTKAIVFKLGSINILKKFPTYNPVHTYISSKYTDSLVFSEEISSIFDKNGKSNDQDIRSLVEDLSNFLITKKIWSDNKIDRKSEEEKIFKDIQAICKEFCSASKPSFK